VITRPCPCGRSRLRRGPGGTGKTWLRQVLAGALWFDLLRTATFLDLSRDPETVGRQALVAEHGRRYRFALSGSSARKLKRLDVNLLAPGRSTGSSFR
jgi:hypothetical protein